MSDNAIAELFDAVPELKDLDAPRRSRVNEFLERRVGLLSRKLASSPFDPHTKLDPHNLNHDFSGALVRWVNQYPAEYRLGFLTSALSVIYLTRDELDVFLNVGTQRLIEALEEMELLQSDTMGTPLPTRDDIQRRIRAYAVSESNVFTAFLHKLSLGGSRDRDVRPVRGTVDEFLEQTYHHLRAIAELGPDYIYYEETTKPLQQSIGSLLNSHVVLVEDCSFSGGRIRKTRQRVLRLIETLFSRHQAALHDRGYRSPTISLLVPCGTSNAQNEVRPEDKTYQASVFGFLLDEGARAVTQLPDNVIEFQDSVDIGPLHDRLRQAVEYFHNTYGKRFAEETQTGRTAHFPIEEFGWGYGGLASGGWTVVTHNNCPNNSLQLLWYPHSDSSDRDIHALFTRVESHVSHTDPANPLEENMDIVQKDEHRFLEAFLTNYYEGMP